MPIGTGMGAGLGLSVLLLYREFSVQPGGELRTLGAPSFWDIPGRMLGFTICQATTDPALHSPDRALKWTKVSP